MKRGDVILVALKGDDGKPRPALIVQSDCFDALASLTVLPITSTLHDAPLLRVRLAATTGNGLDRPSDAMVDKIQSIPQDQVTATIGCLDEATMLEVTRTLALFLGIA
jgi:mRNA interferase MazF